MRRSILFPVLLALVPVQMGVAHAQGGTERTLTLGVYTTPREAYNGGIIPAFQKLWKEKHGQEVRFETSYMGSGAQSRAIVGGFEADIAALSLEPDVTRIQEAGLIKHDWKANPYGGMISQSIVVIGVRPGNPKGIKDWDDLCRPGIEVLTPNVRTSGGAMWNIAAILGAALRGHTSAAKGDTAAAVALISRILAHVTVMDKGARESMLTFERGIGDAIITYENEIVTAKLAGQPYDYVIPASTILIVNPAAVIDVYAEKHGSADVAKAFVEFLVTPEAQRAFATQGYRPVEKTVAAEVAAKFPPVTDLFTVGDLGDWPVINGKVFNEGGIYDRALNASQGLK
jgi:sulfate transport system substrate-binding protein